MKDKIYKWWNRKWSNWEEYSIHEFTNMGWITVTLKRTSNDGLIQYKTIKNY